MGWVVITPSSPLGISASCYLFSYFRVICLARLCKSCSLVVAAFVVVYARAMRRSKAWSWLLIVFMLSMSMSVRQQASVTPLLVRLLNGSPDDSLKFCLRYLVVTPLPYLLEWLLLNDAHIIHAVSITIKQGEKA